MTFVSFNIELQVLSAGCTENVETMGHSVWQVCVNQESLPEVSWNMPQGQK